MKKQIVFLLLSTVFFSGKLFSQVKIGNNPTAIGASSVLEIESTNKGLVFPRMTGAQMNAIASPVSGMYVFNTDSLCICQYNGTFWFSLCGSGVAGKPNFWDLKGNAGTVAGTNFIGTTDAVDFVTKTNNTEKMRVTSAGNVGIGTTAPGQKLEIMNGNVLINNNNNSAGQLMFAEPSTSGTNYVSFKAGVMAANSNYTLPTADGVSGFQLTTNGSGILSWSDPYPNTVGMFIRKPSDESVVNSNVLQDDDDFSFSFAANRYYEVTLMLRISCSNGGQMKIKTVSPAGSTAFIGAMITGPGLSKVTYMPNPTLPYTITNGAVSQNTDIVIIQGTINTAGTPGTFKIEWAQNQADGVPTTIYAGSYCKVLLMQ